MSERDAPPPPAHDEDPDLGASPSYIDSPVLRLEAYKAMIWVGVVGIAVLAVYISQSLLVIFGGLVFAAMIDGGSRLIGRYLPLPRTVRILMVLLATVMFFVWLTGFAGDQIARQAAELPTIVQGQAEILFNWARANGLGIEVAGLQSILGQVLSGVGTLTRVLSGIAGWATSILLITIIGLYVALEPNLYERGVEWMAPRHQRKNLRITLTRMASTLRRLMAGRLVGMLFEGVFTYLLLTVGGQLIGVGVVPMAALLSILTGLLAFVPNIGAIISGVLMITVGFSGGTEMGLYTVFVYLFVQNFDGYVVVPMIAKKTVDLAPALVLGAQLIMGLLFGILGLFLADPLLAMIKVALERRSERNAELQEAAAQRKLAKLMQGN
ncbi:AI-2E family transporter [Erythrobacter sp. SDW2]|uniref:AI-2E family transporter n=1 Tax=Erythrobacter sp. SDW2 TaxID=2907154 RepID=UPI001F48CBB8|nr:AI-2E family transporter [Erythrobacter sp. SDW2]UIP06308.1 AI-2E family transporter [Erythrobacter sp. SDW2]